MSCFLCGFEIFHGGLASGNCPFPSGCMSQVLKDLDAFGYFPCVNGSSEYSVLPQSFSYSQWDEFIYFTVI